MFGISDRICHTCLIGAAPSSGTWTYLKNGGTLTTILILICAAAAQNGEVAVHAQLNCTQKSHWKEWREPRMRRLSICHKSLRQPKDSSLSFLNANMLWFAFMCYNFNHCIKLWHMQQCHICIIWNGLRSILYSSVAYACCVSLIVHTASGTNNILSFSWEEMCRESSKQGYHLIASYLSL